eukprot:SM000018S03714  [mRNA]  locus=s18:972699:975136:- [translate_table: standard]
MSASVVLQELEQIVADHHERGARLRPVGSAISPNGIGLSADGMVNLGLMDAVLKVDQEARRVRVQAGARIEQVVEALRPHGLTLQNYASVREQQVGGFIQVGAHGTGARLPPVDEQVVGLKLVTPGRGTLDLDAATDPALFRLARCALGLLGVVAEVTLQCVPAHRLLEHTYVTSKDDIRRNHKKLLQGNQHVKYLWIPYTDAVVVVTCNPLPEGASAPPGGSSLPEGQRLAHVRRLYKDAAETYRRRNGSDDAHSAPAKEAGAAGEQAGRPKPEGQAGLWTGSASGTPRLPDLSDAEVDGFSFTELRDRLLALDPLDERHVRRINDAEAEYWRLSEGYRIGWSDRILGFDCGGQQWVSEVAFPAGSLQRPDFHDLAYMDDLQGIIAKEGVPAPAPIEQRWTAGSSSPLSPASCSQSADKLYSWVGIIMYLPSEDDSERQAITRKFFDYRRSVALQLWDKYGAQEHWAKIEVPKDEAGRRWLQQRLAERFLLEELEAARRELDPKNILANEMLDMLLPRRGSAASQPDAETKSA